ncbi:MAG: alpha/beta fold hydrolase [Bacteroidota bacterium]
MAKPQIETISKHHISYTKGEPISGGSPIVLVHGAYSSGTLWKENFLPYLAEKGHKVYAIHLKRPEDDHAIRTLFTYTLSDYVAQLKSLVDELGVPPLLIGHSMGGLVVQLFLTQYPTAASSVCLLASLPPFGLKHTLWEMVKSPRRLLMYTLLTLFPAVARSGPPPAGLLSSDASPAKRERFPSLIKRESIRALWGCLFPKIQPDFASHMPMLILGAELDHLALPEDVVATSVFYEKPYRIYANRGHFLMMDKDWEQVADYILQELTPKVIP